MILQSITFEEKVSKYVRYVRKEGMTHEEAFNQIEEDIIIDAYDSVRRYADNAARSFDSVLRQATRRVQNHGKDVLKNG